MKLVVISPETDRPDELSLVRAMLARGLERYHLRKPGWDRAKMDGWLRQLQPVERARVVVHSHHDLAADGALAGTHFPESSAVCSPSRSVGLVSRACHDLPTLSAAWAEYDAILVSPLFPSISKPGYGAEVRIDRDALRTLLSERRRLTAPAGTAVAPEVIGLGGIQESNIETCRALGLDGVAVLGAVWTAADPFAAFLRLQAACDDAAGDPFRRDTFMRSPVLCITQDQLPWTHAEQVRALCAAGARSIQLRIKGASDAAWLAQAREAVAIARMHRAILIVNDSVDIAFAAGADGVHLGAQDLDWLTARRRLGERMILGGTVNHLEDARRAVESGCLDYVGVGPWRFTANKKNLAPILGPDGVRAVVRRLEGLPAWVIGGIGTADLPAVAATGARGVAVSSALFREGKIGANVAAFRGAWPENRLDAAAAINDALPSGAPLASLNFSL